MTDVVATLKARIEQLEAELAAEQQRSARERERADQLITSQDKLYQPAVVLTRLGLNEAACAAVKGRSQSPPV